MSQKILTLIIIFILVVAQSSFYNHLKINESFPNLILTVVLLLAFWQKEKRSWFWIIWGGFCLDIFSINSPLGLSIIALFLAYHLVAWLRKNVFQDINLSSLTLMGLGGILVYRVCLTIAWLVLRQSPSFNIIYLITDLLYNLAFLIIVFYLSNYFFKKRKSHNL